MNDIHNSFRRERKMLNISQTELAKELGVTQSQIAKIETGKSSVTMDIIDKMVKLGANFSDIICNSKGDVREIDPEYIEVELISKYAYAGYLTGYGDMEYLEMLPKVKVIVDKTIHGNYKCFEVKGDSMVDGSFESWLDGDIVLGREVKRELWLPKLHINKCDFIIVHKDGILLKRIIYQDNNNGTITIHSLNPDKSTYPDEEIYLDDVMQIFSTVQLVKRETRR